MLAKFREELKGKSSELELRGSKLNSIHEQLEETRCLAKDAQAKRDHEKEAFQTGREGLLHDLEQARAEEIIEFEAHAKEKISAFKFMKYEQGYIDRALGKPPRYPLEVDVAE